MVDTKKILKTSATVATVAGLGYGISKMASDSSSSSSSSSKKTDNTGNQEVSDTGNQEDSGSSSSSSSSSGGDGDTKSKVVEIPIDNYEDALEFANREWNKIKRDNGRTLECQVLGSTNWRVGEWCKVYLPKFDLDGFMYIIRVSQSSEGGEWTTNLSLVDYPPGWGKEDLTENSDDSDDSSDESEGSDGDSSSSSDDSSTASESNDNSNSSNSGGEENSNMVTIGGRQYHKSGVTR